jgi:protein-tyrosine phosphatase
VAELSQRIRHLSLAGELDRQVLEQWICDRYRLFPTEELDEYRRYVHRLLDGIHFPLLVHCASGKDRTGFAVASTLMALGVAREVILEDYLLSNRYRRSLAPQFPPNTSPETLAALSGVRASYLLAAFGAIDAAWGGDEAFLAQGLGLSAAHRRELQESILESA